VAALQPPAGGLRVRSEVEQAIRDFFYRARVRADRLADPHPGGLRGHLDPVRDRLLRRQGVSLAVGQLYLEPAAAAFGKVYCFGPTFRAEKSKTRRHLMEFWMVEPEVAFLEFDGLQELAEEFVAYWSAACSSAAAELEVLERDTEARGGPAAVPAHHATARRSRS
jgi:asparaginyl-tRNA synthetase